MLKSGEEVWYFQGAVTASAMGDVLIHHSISNLAEGNTTASWGTRALRLLGSYPGANPVYLLWATYPSRPLLPFRAPPNLCHLLKGLDQRGLSMAGGIKPRKTSHVPQQEDSRKGGKPREQAAALTSSTPQNLTTSAPSSAKGITIAMAM